MSYLGRSAKLSLKAQEKVSFLAAAGQTEKTGLSYIPTFVEVIVNGALLTDTVDYAATNGNSITFTVALVSLDEVTVISLKTFTVADHYTKSAADTLLAAKLAKAGGALTGPITNFESTGIDDTLATATSIVVGANGEVTKPLQPAFSAVSSGDQSNISLTGESTVVFGTEIFDQNNDFTANTFTAPVAGRYLLNTMLRLDDLDSAANYYRLYIVTSNRTYFTIWTTLRFSADINYWSLQNTAFADMDAGDTAYVAIQQSAGSVQTDITSGQSYFQGHLVC
jgi:hypothetical protein